MLLANRLKKVPDRAIRAGRFPRFGLRAAAFEPSNMDACDVSSHLMKPKRLKVYARLGLISTKLPIVNDLIEIITHIQMYQNNMKMVLDRYTAIQERFSVSRDTCNALCHM